MLNHSKINELLNNYSLIELKELEKVVDHQLVKITSLQSELIQEEEKLMQLLQKYGTGFLPK